MIQISERVDKLLKEGKPVQVHLGNQWVDFDGSDYELLKFHRSDIREKPEKDFVIGDWWVPWKNAKPEKLTKDTIKYYIGTKPYAQYVEATLWQPQPGEWVILDSGIQGDMFVVQKFNGHTPLKSRCEPYLGTLPTHLKDN